MLSITWSLGCDHRVDNNDKSMVVTEIRSFSMLPALLTFACECSQWILRQAFLLWSHKARLTVNYLCTACKWALEVPLCHSGLCNISTSFQNVKTLLASRDSFTKNCFMHVHVSFLQIGNPYNTPTTQYPDMICLIIMLSQTNSEIMRFVSGYSFTYQVWL